MPTSLTVEFILIQSAVSMTTYVVFTGIRKTRFVWTEALVIFAALFVFASVIPMGILPIDNMNIASMISNLVAIIILTVASYIKTKPLTLSATYAFFSMIIILFAANLMNFVMDVFLAVFFEDTYVHIDMFGDRVVPSSIYLLGISIVGCFVPSRFGNEFRGKIEKLSFCDTNKLSKALLFISAITLVLFFSFIHVIHLVESPVAATMIYTVVVCLGFAGSVFALLTFTDNIGTQVELSQKEEMLRNLEEFIDRQDVVTSELKQFRHDHRNLLIGFKAYIENDDITGLKRYFDEYMSSFMPLANAADAVFNKLGSIGSPAVRGLLQAKCIQAQSLGVNVWVEVVDAQFINDANLLDTCRIIGIFMDNAIEACQGINSADIRVLVAPDDSGVYFVFENTCQNPPSLMEMNKNGFSTKGEGRGSGLGNVSGILAKNGDIIKKTSIKQDLFIQELWVLNSY